MVFQRTPTATIRDLCLDNHALLLRALAGQREITSRLEQLAKQERQTKKSR